MAMLAIVSHNQMVNAIESPKVFWGWDDSPVARVPVLPGPPAPPGRTCGFGRQHQGTTRCFGAHRHRHLRHLRCRDGIDLIQKKNGQSLIVREKRAQQIPSGNDCYIAIENTTFIVDLPIQNGDFL